jgi:DUF4097 and DUF4098 domain-containing protein YvlB
MRMTGLGRSVVLSAAVLAIPALAAAQTETETVNRTVSLGDHGTLVLKNFSGDITITAAGGRDVVIKATRTARREQLDHIKLDISSSGSTVTINANKRDAGWGDHDDNVVKTAFDIQLPASTHLDVDAFSSDVTITGVTADQKLHTFSGDITVSGGQGALDAKTFSGGIDVDVTAAGASPDVRAETFSGGIRAKLASNAKGSVSFDSFSGSFESALPLTVHSMSRRKMSGDLPGGSEGRTLNFHTFSGDVHILK